MTTLHNDKLVIKEEFYTPTILIKESDLHGWCLHIIGQVDKCLVLVCRIVCDATKNSREFLAGLVSSKSDNLVRKHAIRIMHGITFTYDFILKISSLPYHKIGFNLIDMIESLQVNVSSVKHVVGSLLIRDFVHRTLVMYLSLRNVYKRRDVRLSLKQQPVQILTEKDTEMFNAHPKDVLKNSSSPYIIDISHAEN